MWPLNLRYGIYLPSSSNQANQKGWRVISELPLKKYSHAFYKQTGQSQQEKINYLFSFRICDVVRFWDCKKTKKTKYYYYFLYLKTTNMTGYLGPVLWPCCVSCWVSSSAEHPYACLSLETLAWGRLSCSATQWCCPFVPHGSWNAYLTGLGARSAVFIYFSSLPFWSTVERIHIWSVAKECLVFSEPSSSLGSLYGKK